jgi:type I restriction enzyme S subunit
MKTGWQTKTLGDVAEVGAGNSAPQAERLFAGGTYPFFRTSDAGRIRLGDIHEAADYLNDEGIKGLRRFPKGTILFPKSGASTFLNHRVMLGVEGFVSSHLATIVADKTQIDPRFLLYFLTTISAQDMIQDHAYPSLNLPSIAGIRVLVPPLPEQRRIVGILDEAFEGIATAKANAEKNLHNARALFDSILNAAITGELTREWRRLHPATQIASEHLQQTLIKRRNQWKGPGKYVELQPPVCNRPIDIPTSWTLASPEQLSTHIIDCPHSTPKWTKSGMVCLRTTNFEPGFLDLELVQFVSEETYNERIMRLEPKPGDIVYSREGGILGIACIIPYGLKACLGQRMMQLRLDSNVALPEFFAGALNSTLILSEVKRLTGGAAEGVP